MSHLTQSVPTTAVVVASAAGATFTAPHWIKCTATGTVTVTPFDGGSAIAYVVASAPDEVPFAVRAVAAGSTVADGNIIASKLEA